MNGEDVTAFFVSFIIFFCGLAVLWLTFPNKRAPASTTPESTMNLAGGARNPATPTPINLSSAVDSASKEGQPHQFQKALYERSRLDPAEEVGDYGSLIAATNQYVPSAGVVNGRGASANSVRRTPESNKDVRALVQDVLDLSEQLQFSSRESQQRLRQEVSRVKAKFATWELLETVAFLHSQGFLGEQESRKLRALFNLY